MKELYKKLSLVKAEIGKISKDSENPFFKSMYFDINSLLEHVEPLLQKNGLLLIQPIIGTEVVSQIIDVETDQSLSSGLKLPDLSDPQKIGSAVTYYRRYTLQSLLGLQAQDDDGNRASQKITNEKPTGTKFSDRDTSKDVEKEWIAIADKAWNKALDKQMPLEELRKFYKVSRANGEEYLKQLTSKIQ